LRTPKASSTPAKIEIIDDEMFAAGSTVLYAAEEENTGYFKAGIRTLLHADGVLASRYSGRRKALPEFPPNYAGGWRKIILRHAIEITDGDDLKNADKALHKILYCEEGIEDPQQQAAMHEFHVAASLDRWRELAISRAVKDLLGLRA
jgi:hypothetical protein